MDIYNTGGRTEAHQSEMNHANLMEAGQLPDAPAGVPVDPTAAVTEAMTNRERNARPAGLS